MRMNPCRVMVCLVATWAVVHPVAGQDEKDEKDKKSDIKPYDEVITDEAVTDTGLFTVHTIGDRLYYEILPDGFGPHMLWVTQIAQTQAGHSYAGMPVGDRVVRWELKGQKVLLRDVHYTIRADVDDPIRNAVEATSLAPIIKVLPVKAYGKDKSVVIDVTDLFKKDVPEFSAGGALGAKGMDSERSFIEQVKSFPKNIETKVLATYKLESEGSRARASAVTAIIHHSMVLLPSNPMQPRRWDSRVGFFRVAFTDYSDDSKHEAESVRYISRWRLEKKDPEAELSDPIAPIVWYVGRGVPEKWKPYVKEGIELWQPAFEAAGFTNAIIGRYAPDPREDPDWDAEDTRYSTIRWLPSEITNAFGPHVHDPRTGEILEADVRMHHNVMKLVRDWYFVQASPSDARAQELPMPDDLMGELIRFVVAHEVGHSIGLPHNMKASSSYTVAQLRDPEWTKANGTAPSIMDYARFNYVAQPGDGAALMPRVGPYDHFAIEWGYRQYPDSDAEREGLRKLFEMQIEEPMYRYGGGSGVDPTAQTEDLSRDAVEATTLGLANLDRIAAYLVEATCSENDDYSLLSDMYDALLAQWNREIGHVISLVGGVEEINLYYGDADSRYFRIEPHRQREAAAFLIENALTTPEMFIEPDVVARLTSGGVADRVLSAQNRVLRRLVSRSRISRMADAVESLGDDAYAPSELLDDLSAGLFGEFSQDNATVDLYRRNLQRAYVELLAAQLDDAATDSDLPALARAQLHVLATLLERAEPADDQVSAAHRLDLIARIEDAFDND
ncbi:MAG: zinc-dependent metalloprotease [Planctomycetes bacterium]|nr:zinc-dependent metalloprotease [Planctomycetota bacterium]